MSNFTAFCDNIDIKTGVGRNGKPYTVYNVRCTTAEGDNVRLGWGFNAPNFREGQWFKTTVQTNDRGYLEYAKNSPVEVKDGAAPAASGAGSAAGATASSASVTGPASNGRQDSIEYQNSRTAAITLVGHLLAADALPISTAKDKNGRAKRFEQIIEITEKLTVQKFKDLQTMRLLEKHQDAGVIEVPSVEDLPPEDAAVDLFEDEVAGGAGDPF